MSEKVLFAGHMIYKSSETKAKAPISRTIILKFTHQKEMATFRILLLALLFAASVLCQTRVEATFWDTTYFTWGAHHSQIMGYGNDLQLILDNTSGNYICGS